MVVSIKILAACMCSLAIHSPREPSPNGLRRLFTFERGSNPACGPTPGGEIRATGSLTLSNPSAAVTIAGLLNTQGNFVSISAPVISPITSIRMTNGGYLTSGSGILMPNDTEQQGNYGEVLTTDQKCSVLRSKSVLVQRELEKRGLRENILASGRRGRFFAWY